ncbi:DNA-binding protein [Corynebacterium sp. HMSC08F01]|uniref:septation protein SepH n=1 Tax=unclassified Corynebacterium TaxID=2624378 RepID=UPI0008A6532E|nr:MULTISPECIES: septation protein SepH [unclassified Corynebacterium]OFL16705.1 DNA-binding protein [Corynebacterium sp. HMSC067D03]OFT29577.1 DNA-binding protein [Corynebacterium sp. HMSC08F01]
MRELVFLEDESTETFFVLRDEEGVRYQLAREELAPLLIDDSPAPEEPATDTEVTEEEQPAQPVAPAPEPRPLPEPDPLYATPLSMRPNEIQARIRAGATAAELAEEMGVAESRLESYAHPVLLERAQVAEAAKQSHPVREDGPAKQTLLEILATSFAARGHSISDAEWDATREQGDTWVVRVTWQAGLTENEALWSFKRSMGAAAQTEARNAMAADLTDPDFAQPVRSLSAVRSLHGEQDEAAPAAPVEILQDAPAEEGEVLEGDFLRHPDEEEQPQKRRRKSVTPHWEDVLLGVRTNTKRPKR